MLNNPRWRNEELVMIMKPTYAHKYIKVSYKYNIPTTCFGLFVDILSENVMPFPEDGNKNGRNMWQGKFYKFTCICWFRYHF